MYLEFKEILNKQAYKALGVIYLSEEQFIRLAKQTACVYRLNPRKTTLDEITDHISLFLATPFGVSALKNIIAIDNDK